VTHPIDGEAAGSTTAPAKTPPAGGPRAARRLRSLGAWFLLVVACIGIPLSVTVIWVNQTIKDQGQFVSTFAPLATNPSVASSITDHVTDQIVEAASQQPNASPTAIAFVKPKVHASVAAAVGSPAFSQIWTEALEGTHAVLTAALDGSASSGAHIVVNLAPLAAEAVHNLDVQGITAFDGVLGSARAGTFALKVAPSDKLTELHSTYDLMGTLEWLIPLMTLAALAGAVLLAPRRRRVLIGLGIGVSLVSLATLVGLGLVRNAIVDSIHSGSTGAGAAFDALSRYLRLSFTAVMIAGLVLLVAAMVTVAMGARPARPARGRASPRVAPPVAPVADEA
jgi:hypothetical protein